MLVRMCRFICGDGWNPVHVSVAHPEPPDASYFYAYFRCPVMFGAEANALEIDTAIPFKEAREQVLQQFDHLAPLSRSPGPLA